MTHKEQLLAYLATLGALCFIFGAALIAAGHDVTVNEAFGMGTITGGLIGVLRLPSGRAPAAMADSGGARAGKPEQDVPA